MEDIIGRRVVFKSNLWRQRLPQFYPVVGTVGTVLLRSQVIRDGYYIQWPKGTTSGNDKWFCRRCDFEIKSCIKCM